MRRYLKPAYIALFSSLSGCGTFVPPLKEYPFNYNDNQNNSMVQGIISSIKCELREAVTKAVNLELKNSESFGRPNYSNYYNG